MDALFFHLKSFLTSGSATSMAAAVVLAYFGGILSSFTPCIYPMIPITIGLIGGTRERTIRDGWILSSFYVLGMACVFTLLGVAASLSGKIFGSMTNSTGWYLGLGIVLTIASLWMLDVLRFDPNVLIHRFFSKFRKSVARTPKTETDSDENDATLLGAFALGASSGFVAAPCTTPVLTTILAYVATEKSLGLGVLLMFAFAMGLGTILVFIGTFAGALKLLPKSGRWLSTIKLGSGLLILGLGMYYVFKAGTFR